MIDNTFKAFKQATNNTISEDADMRDTKISVNFFIFYEFLVSIYNIQYLVCQDDS